MVERWSGALPGKDGCELPATLLRRVGDADRPRAPVIPARDAERDRLAARVVARDSGLSIVHGVGCLSHGRKDTARQGMAWLGKRRRGFGVDRVWS